ncbi:MAG: signal peptidase I [Candidatus Nanopelagicaceae bacterium]|jgi:signal peptidase I
MANAVKQRIDLFPDSPEIDIWVENSELTPSSNILVTISSLQGEKTSLIRPGKVVETKAKYFVQTPPERVVTGRDKTMRKVKSAFVAIGYVLAAILISFSALSFTDVVKARIVLTESMKPAINSGDLILTVSPERLTPKVGDVVSYTARRFDGAPVGTFSHRIIDGDPVTGFTLKGDNNPKPDVQRPNISDIDGVVIFVLPYLGLLLSPRALFIIIPSIFGFWLVMDALRGDDEIQ